MSLDSLFGAPLQLGPLDRDEWIATISRDWTRQMGRPPQSLAVDLQALKPLFGAGASPKAVRRRVHLLPPADLDSQHLPAPIGLAVDGCTLITPEGRVFLDVLGDMRSTGSTEIGPAQQIHALELASALRAQWHTEWLRKQFEGSLSASVLGAALFLLVNGSVGAERALRLPGDEGADHELGNVVLPLIERFSEDLGGREIDISTGIRQHWAFSQLSRLLSRHVDRQPAKPDTIIFIRPGSAPALLDELARRLERTADPHRRRRSVLAFVDGYRSARGMLAALDQMHEDPTLTRRIVARLSDPAATP